MSSYRPLTNISAQLQHRFRALNEYRDSALDISHNAGSSFVPALHADQQSPHPLGAERSSGTATAKASSTATTTLSARSSQDQTISLYSPSPCTQSLTGSAHAAHPEKALRTASMRQTPMRWIARAANSQSLSEHLCAAAALPRSRNDVVHMQRDKVSEKRQPTPDIRAVSEKKPVAQYDSPRRFDVGGRETGGGACEASCVGQHHAKPEQSGRRLGKNSFSKQSHTYCMSGDYASHAQQRRSCSQDKAGRDTDGAVVANHLHEKDMADGSTERNVNGYNRMNSMSLDFEWQEAWHGQPQQETARSTAMTSTSTVARRACAPAPSAMLVTLTQYVACTQRVLYTPLHVVRDRAVITAFDKYLGKGTTMLKFKAHGGAPHKRTFCIRFLDDGDVEPYDGVPNRHRSPLSRPMFCWYRRPHSLHVQGMRPLSDLIAVQGDESSHPFVQARRARAGLLRGARSGVTAHEYCDNQFILKFMFRVADGVVLRKDDRDKLAVVAQAPNECVYCAWQVLGAYLENFVRS